MEHDGSAISVFDKHPNEGHTNENIVGVVVLWRENKYHIDTVRSSHYQRNWPLCGHVSVQNAEGGYVIYLP